MFQVHGSEGEEMALKAMNCPGHYAASSPARCAATATCRSAFTSRRRCTATKRRGVLSGLTRVRQFSQDDAHCFVTQEQIGDEVERLLGLVQPRLRRFRPAVPAEARDAAARSSSARSRPGTRPRRSSARRSTRPATAYTLNEGDGAFYGPKIDFDVTDAIGRKWQCATIQLDYQMPERFDLKYIGADNAEHRPVVIHRAIFGSFERFIAILIEHYAGAFPLWLAPVQAIVLPIADRHLDYAGVGPRPPAGGRAPRRPRRAPGKDWI